MAKYAHTLTLLHQGFIIRICLFIHLVIFYHDSSLYSLGQRCTTGGPRARCGPPAYIYVALYKA